ncbi:hypothetical protein FGO68_gene13898 [Halteria grandinella]|uniref:Uncharacterized protein n=1 Tax=Halteria grandinella TaxID=5974 RepID=A0A8J8P1D7_HALGN|nr:hypothetical protein FGO68_gene13898 [Halteria grandinella]
MASSYRAGYHQASSNDLEHILQVPGTSSYAPNQQHGQTNFGSGSILSSNRSTSNQQVTKNRPSRNHMSKSASMALLNEGVQKSPLRQTQPVEQQVEPTPQKLAPASPIKKETIPPKPPRAKNPPKIVIKRENQQPKLLLNDQQIDETPHNKSQVADMRVPLSRYSLTPQTLMQQEINPPPISQSGHSQLADRFSMTPLEPRFNPPQPPPAFPRNSTNTPEVQSSVNTSFVVLPTQQILQLDHNPSANDVKQMSKSVSKSNLSKHLRSITQHSFDYKFDHFGTLATIFEGMGQVASQNQVKKVVKNMYQLQLDKKLPPQPQANGQKKQPAQDIMVKSDQKGILMFGESLVPQRVVGTLQQPRNKRESRSQEQKKRPQNAQPQLLPIRKSQVWTQVSPPKISINPINSASPKNQLQDNISDISHVFEGKYMQGQFAPTAPPKRLSKSYTNSTTLLPPLLNNDSISDFKLNNIIDVAHSKLALNKPFNYTSQTDLSTVLSKPGLEAFNYFMSQNRPQQHQQHQFKSRNQNPLANSQQELTLPSIINQSVSDLRQYQQGNSMFRTINGQGDGVKQVHPSMSYKSLSKAREQERRGLNTQIIIEETIPTAVDMDESIKYNIYPLLDKNGKPRPQLPQQQFIPQPYEEHPTLSGNIKKQYINRIQQILNEIVSQRRMANSNFLPLNKSPSPERPPQNKKSNEILGHSKSPSPQGAKDRTSPRILNGGGFSLTKPSKMPDVVVNLNELQQPQMRAIGKSLDKEKLILAKKAAIKKHIKNLRSQDNGKTNLLTSPQVQGYLKQLQIIEQSLESNSGQLTQYQQLPGVVKNSQNSNIKQQHALEQVDSHGKWIPQKHSKALLMIQREMAKAMIEHQQMQGQASTYSKSRDHQVYIPPEPGSSPQPSHSPTKRTNHFAYTPASQNHAPKSPQAHVNFSDKVLKAAVGNPVLPFLKYSNSPDLSDTLQLPPQPAQNNIIHINLTLPDSFMLLQKEAIADQQNKRKVHRRSTKPVAEQVNNPYTFDQSQQILVDGNIDRNILHQTLTKIDLSPWQEANHHRQVHSPAHHLMQTHYEEYSAPSMPSGVQSSHKQQAKFFNKEMLTATRKPLVESKQNSSGMQTKGEATPNS